MTDLKISNELREKALARPNISILRIGEGDSHLEPFRGEAILRTFSDFYQRHATVRYCTASPSMLVEMGSVDLRHYNVLWLEGVSQMNVSQKLYAIHDALMNEIEPNWRQIMGDMHKVDSMSAYKYMKELNARRANEKLRIVYQLDEFVWEGVVGRMRDIHTVQVVESFMSIADVIVVPTPELKEAITHYKLANDPEKDIQVVLTGVGVEFCPLFRDPKRPSQNKVDQLKEKPRILVKGLTIPTNIDAFICDNYKKMDITISSVGEASEHLRGLISMGKVKHIYHWANPYVNKTNVYATWALERDAGFDFVILTKPDDLKGKMYEICSGDEDILFAAAYGALPIAGYDHLGYDEEAHHLSILCPTFGNDSTPKSIREIIGTHQVWTKYAESYGKVRAAVEARLVASPAIMGRYFAICIGPELSMARSTLAAEKIETLEANEASEATEATPKFNKMTPKNDENIIVGNFSKEA